MNSVFDIYSDLWKDTKQQQALRALLCQAEVIHYPEDKEILNSVKKPQSVVVVLTNGTVKEMVQLGSMGFEHLVQKNREDFAQELLVSSMMAVRPEAFAKNPIPFFFTGFQPPETAGTTDRNLVAQIHKGSDRDAVIQNLTTFLSQNARLSGVQDLCVQAADEMISNAIFSAPVDFKGMPLFRDKDRKFDAILPKNKPASLFACYNDHRVVIGCEDLYGSLKRNYLWEHLESIFWKEQATTREGGGGAGIGMKYMIENSANFYLYVDRGKRTLFACSFLLKGVKANLMALKHLHFSFR